MNIFKIYLLQKEKKEKEEEGEEEGKEGGGESRGRGWEEEGGEEFRNQLLSISKAAKRPPF